MASSASPAAAPLVHTPIQLAVHTHAHEEHAAHICSTRASNTHRAHVALGDVVRLRASGVRRRRGLAASVEQGVAVVLMDMHTQTPVNTYTLAPSDRVCTPPLVVERSVGDAAVRTTYLGVQRLDATNGADASTGTDVWVLTERLDARGRHVPGADTEKTTFHVPGILQSLFALPSGDLLGVRADAVVLLADPLGAAPGTVQATHAGDFAVRYDTQLGMEGVPRLVLVHGTPRGVALAMVDVQETEPRLHAHAPVHDLDVRDVESAAGDGHGTLAVLLRSGALVVAPMSDTAHTVTFGPLRDAAARLVFLSPSHLLLLALPSGGEKGKERAAALVWDVELDAVLAHAEWSLGGVVPGARIAATRADDTHLLLLLDMPQRDVVRSSVLALPVSVPPVGLLAHALHAAQPTDAWVTPASASATAPLPAAHAAFLARVHALPPPERTSELDTYFQAFLNEESARLRAEAQVKASRKAPKPALPTAFVQAVLALALPPAEKHQAPRVSVSTLRYLLERGVVSASMVDRDALVPRLRAVHDWTTLYLVLRHVPDLSEAHAVSIVRDALVARHDDAAPTVARVLQHVLAPPPFSKPALRMALRTHIVHNDEVLILLDLVRCWLEAQAHAPLVPAKEARGADRMRHVPGTAVAYRTSDVRAPPLDAVASFGEDVLDTFFPQLLADTSTHVCLAECTRALTHATHGLQTLARLSAPLDVFAHAATSRGPKAEPKSKRLALHEASLLVPLYSRETLDV